MYGVKATYNGVPLPSVGGSLVRVQQAEPIKSLITNRKHGTHSDSEAQTRRGNPTGNRHVTFASMENKPEASPCPNVRGKPTWIKAKNPNVFARRNPPYDFPLARRARYLTL
jgi:hypothetical protein